MKQNIIGRSEKRSAIAFDVDDLVEAKALFPLYNLGTGTVAGSPAAAKALSESTDHIGARKQQHAYLQTLRDSIALLEYHRSIALWSFNSESLIGVPYYTTAHTHTAIKKGHSTTSG